MPEPLQMTYDEFAATNLRIALDWMADLGYKQSAISWAEAHQGRAIDVDSEHYDAWSDLGDALEFVAFVMRRLVTSTPARDDKAELVQALKKWALCKDAYDAEPQFEGLYAELVSAENGLLAALAAVGEGEA